MIDATISVALMIVAVYAGYVSMKWADNWSYWSHRCCAAAVIGLGWMALPQQPPLEEPRLSEQKALMMDRIAHHYAVEQIERENHGHD